MREDLSKYEESLIKRMEGTKLFSLKRFVLAIELAGLCSRA